MARFVDDRTSDGVFGPLLLAVGDFVRRIKDSFAWSAAFRTTYDELQSLSDRELNDLGIVREDLPQIARKAADDAMVQK